MNRILYLQHALLPQEDSPTKKSQIFSEIRTLLTAVLITCLLSGLIIAQDRSGKISGVVTDPAQKPVAEVYVSLNPINRTALTGQNGYFEFSGIPAGTYSLSFRHISYQDKSIKDISVDAGQITEVETVQLQERIFPSEEVSVTATRTERNLFEVSKPLNLVNSRQIENREAKTSAEALREEAGLFVQKTNHGGGSAIIRGLSSNQILLLVDGIRLNNSTYRLGNHQYLTTVDNQMVDRIEVVRGPSSLMYGSDALGGTINILTRNPDFVSGGLQFQSRLFNRYATADEEKTSRAEFQLQNHRIAFIGGLSYKNYGDLKRGSSNSRIELEQSTDGVFQRPSGYKAYDMDGKILLALTPDQYLSAVFQQTRQYDVPRYDKYENDGYFLWNYEPQQRQLTYLRYENHLRKHYLNSVRTTVSYHLQEEGRQMQKSSDGEITNEADRVRTLGLTIDLNSVLGNHLLTYGSEFYFDKVSSNRYFLDPQTNSSEEDIQGRYPDGARYNSYGLFLQDEVQLRPSTLLSLGLRYSYFTTDFAVPEGSFFSSSDGNFSQNFKSLTSSLGLVHQIIPGLYLNCNVGQAFRAPNLSDISKLGESKGNIYEIPNPDLGPEKMLSIDAGFKINTPRIFATFSVYYSRITDLLASAETTYNGSSTIEINGIQYQLKSKKNIGNAYIRGTEAEFRYRLSSHLETGANLAYTYGQNTTLAEPVGGIPPLFGLVNVKWQKPEYGMEFFVRFAGKQDRLSADDLDDPRIPPGGTPSWNTLNLRGNIRIQKYIRLRGAVENILDQNYREHGSGINGPGRNFILSLELNSALQ